MTTIETRPEPIIDQTQASAEDINGTQQYLAPIVWDLQALVIDGKQAHWHIRGENFIAVHELLDKVVKHAQKYADLAAERTVALGLPIDARIQTVAAKSSLPQMKDGFQNYGPMIEQVVGRAPLRRVRGVRSPLRYTRRRSIPPSRARRGVTTDRRGA